MHLSYFPTLVALISLFFYFSKNQTYHKRLVREGKEAVTQNFNLSDLAEILTSAQWAASVVPLWIGWISNLQ